MVKLDRCLSILDEVATIDFEIFLLGSADDFVARPHVDTWLIIIRLFGNKLRFPSMKSQNHLIRQEQNLSRVLLILFFI